MNKIFFVGLFFLFNNILLSNNSIDIINFNIYGFGKFVGGCEVENNINTIIDEVFNYDIIFIQENWKYDDLFRKKLKNHQLIFANNKKNNLSSSSGLLIAVNKNIDIITNDEILYTDCNGIISNGNDCFASKGFTFTKIKLNNNVIDLYNTHLDAGLSSNDLNVRLKQLNVLKEYIYKHSNQNNLILCGDFNIDYYTSSEIKEFQNDLNLNILKWNDNYFLENKIDYIFYRMDQSYKISEKNISNILYTLSDHPPMGLNLNY